MRVAVLALCLRPTSAAAPNAPRGYGGASGWGQRLQLLTAAVGRFRDYRLLVHAQDQSPEGAAGLKRACGDHRRVHCHHQTFHSRGPGATDPGAELKTPKGPGPRDRGYQRRRRQLLDKAGVGQTVRYPFGARASEAGRREQKKPVRGGGDGEEKESAAEPATSAVFNAAAYAASASVAREAGAELAYAKRSPTKTYLPLKTRAARHAHSDAAVRSHARVGTQRVATS
jgi:hypothetical protein